MPTEVHRPLRKREGSKKLQKAGKYLMHYPHRWLNANNMAHHKAKGLQMSHH